MAWFRRGQITASAKDHDHPRYGAFLRTVQRILTVVASGRGHFFHFHYWHASLLLSSRISGNQHHTVRWTTDYVQVVEAPL